MFVPPTHFGLAPALVFAHRLCAQTFNSSYKGGPFFFEVAWKIFVNTCTLCPGYLALASRKSVLVKSVLGLGLGFVVSLALASAMTCGVMSSTPPLLVNVKPSQLGLPANIKKVFTYNRLFLSIFPEYINLKR